MGPKSKRKFKKVDLNTLSENAAKQTEPFPDSKKTSQSGKPRRSRNAEVTENNPTDVEALSSANIEEKDQKSWPSLLNTSKSNDSTSENFDNETQQTSCSSTDEHWNNSWKNNQSVNEDPDTSRNNTKGNSGYDPSEHYQDNYDEDWEENKADSDQSRNNSRSFTSRNSSYGSGDKHQIKRGRNESTRWENEDKHMQENRTGTNTRKSDDSFDRNQRYSKGYPQNSNTDRSFQRDNQNWRAKDDRKFDKHRSGTSDGNRRNASGNFKINKDRSNTERCDISGISKLDISDKSGYNSSFGKSNRKSDSSRYSGYSYPVLPEHVDDEEYMQFYGEDNDVGCKIDYGKVEEIDKDLFQMPGDFSLGHCVAADMRMGSGIAVTFKKKFGRLADLLSQYQRPGGLAVLDNDTEVGKRYVYYLVTKHLSSGKPTYENFWYSLKKMRDHVRAHEVKKLAIPKIGCGLDRLDWDTVKHMVEFLFKDVDVEIVVCNYQQDEDATPQKDNICKVVFDEGPVAKIADSTIIIYFATEKGEFEEDVMDLSAKFNFMDAFKKADKTLGNAIRYVDKNKYYILYGCIVRKSKNDRFDFRSFAKCLSEIKKQNKKDSYYYIAYQTIVDRNDDYINDKIITLLRNLLNNVDVYVCKNDQMVDLGVDE